MTKDDDFHTNALTGSARRASRGIKRTAVADRPAQFIKTGTPSNNVGRFFDAPGGSIQQDVRRRRDTLRDEMPGE
jgi:hypothetical protein